MEQYFSLSPSDPLSVWKIFTIKIVHFRCPFHSPHTRAHRRSRAHTQTENIETLIFYQNHIRHDRFVRKCLLCCCNRYGTMCFVPFICVRRPNISLSAVRAHNWYCHYFICHWFKCGLLKNVPYEFITVWFMHTNMHELFYIGGVMTICLCRQRRCFCFPFRCGAVSNKEVNRERSGQMKESEYDYVCPRLVNIV